MRQCRKSVTKSKPSVCFRKLLHCLTSKLTSLYLRSVCVDAQYARIVKTQEEGVMVF